MHVFGKSRALSTSLPRYFSIETCNLEAGLGQEAGRTDSRASLSERGRDDKNSVIS